MKQFMRYIFISVACVLLAACGGEESTRSERSGITEPDNTGAFEVINSIWNHETLNSSNGNGKVSFVLGLRGNQVNAYAGVWPQTAVNPITTSSGSATMSGSFQVVFAEYLRTETSGGGSNRGIYVRDGDSEVIIPRGENTPVERTQIWDPKVTDVGVFSATINFDNGTITGQSTNSRDLLINGTFNSDGSIEGNSNFRGVGGDLGGLVGSDEAIGAVSGNNSSLVYSGGFVVSE